VQHGTRRCAAVRAAVCVGVLSLSACLASSVAFAQGPNRRGLYVPPISSFIHDPAETPLALAFDSVPLADIQQQLDAARASNPDSPIVLTLTGSYTVTDAPLTLPSNTSLVLYGTIKADPGASASSLIAIIGQHDVSVAGGFLDGRDVNLSGIDAETSGRINIDAVTITNTGRDGIVLRGQGNNVWNSGSAITRCEIAYAGGNGITIGSITQTLILDSFVRSNAGAGIRVSAAHSSIVNNVSQDNDVGIAVDANDDLIADNELRSNRSGGLRLETASANTAVLRNAVVDNTVAGIDLDGNNNLVFSNALQNPTDLADHASGNWVVARGTPLQAPVSRYFYPPTIDNRHAEPIMNGRGRFDLAVDASTSPTISQVQQLYNAARQQHPDDVLVLTLTGAFTVDSASLLLQSRTAVLLDGTITIPTNIAVDQAITATNPAEFISMSGGTIDLLGRSLEGIFFPSTTMAYFDQVTVTRGGQRDVRAGKGMIHLTRGGGYTILRGNTVDTSGGRCIWTQNANTRYVILENLLTNCNQDGVDFDSSTSNSVAFGNTLKDNVRYGVFIEQSDSFNKIYGNSATTRGIPGIPGRAVGVYNNATSAGTRGITDKNTIFSNVSDVIADGLRLGSISTATGGVAETAHSFFFNNIIKNSRGNGILIDTQFVRSIENYFSQTVLVGNGNELNSHPSNNAGPPEFFNPPAAIDLALHQPATASSSAPDSSPDAAVDGLAYTSWNAGATDVTQSWLTIDLGGEVRFGRVMLKQSTARVAIVRIDLQMSKDGVNFIDIPGTARKIELKPVNNVTFDPVSARFLRVRVTKRAGGGSVGFEEISVHAQ